MKIEKISDNQIKCTLFRSDFEDRHLTIKDFFGGSEKARKLFADVLREAGSEFDFYAENVPVMIEAIPAARDSLTVIITRVDDAEEASNRFKNRPRAEELLASLEKLMGAFADDKVAEESVSYNTESQKEKSACRAFVYRDLREVKTACAVLSHIFYGESSLYRHPSSGQYYLTLTDKIIDSETFDMICNSIVEYGMQVGGSSCAEAYYSEHYETVYKDNAIAMVTK